MTSIEILINELKKYEGLENIEWFATKDIDKAKEMHKQEIITAFELWRSGSGEQYYQETFVRKGSDNLTKEIIDFMKREKERKTEITEHKNLCTYEEVQKMIDDALINYEIGFADRKAQLPQQEISDEEIEKAAANLANPNADKTDNWIEGSKWYKEQLKQNTK